MSSSGAMHHAVSELRSILARTEKDGELKTINDAKEDVLARYQPTFAPQGIDQLTREDFRDFLMFRNNRHWSGLQRLGPRITSDIDALKEALRELIDEKIPVAERLDRLLPNGKARVRNLGKAVLTPILLICHPDQYGVWNGTSGGAMVELGIWPDFERSASIGERYEKLNQLLLQIAGSLDVGLWTLDALWWRVKKPAGEIVDEDEEPETEQEGIGFGLERHLHDFLFDNWEKTDLGKEWNLDEDGGDIKGYGYERPTSIGKIDLLAKHKTDARWLVIELKRGQSSDDTVGQVLRYMGWVEEQLAAVGETVEGLIISQDIDEKLRYALKPTQRIRVMRYEVDFRLREPETSQAEA